MEEQHLGVAELDWQAVRATTVDGCLLMTFSLSPRASGSLEGNGVASHDNGLFSGLPLLNCASQSDMQMSRAMREVTVDGKTDILPVAARLD